MDPNLMDQLAKVWLKDVVKRIARWWVRDVRTRRSDGRGE